MDAIYKQWDQLITEAITEANILHSLCDAEREPPPVRHPEMPGCYVEVERLSNAELQKYLLKNKRKHGTDKAHDTLYDCYMCQAEYPSFEMLQQHFLSKHIDTALYHCKKCSKTFVTKSGISKHNCNAYLKKQPKFVHLKVYPNTCKICSKMFRYNVSYEQHMQKYHKILGEIEITHTKTNTKANNYEDLNSHKRSSQSTVYRCSFCDRRYSYKARYKKHVQKCNAAKEKLSPLSQMYDPSLFYCYNCGKSFISKCKVRAHIYYAHLNIYRYGCTLCSQEFSSTSNLKVHMIKAHSNDYVTSNRKLKANFLKTKK